MEYIVKSGDTLSKIARDVLGDMAQWPEIALRNGIAAPYTLQVGQVLRLTDDAPAPSPSRTVSPIRRIETGTTIVAPIPRRMPAWTSWLFWGGAAAAVIYFLFPPAAPKGSRRKRGAR